MLQRVLLYNIEGNVYVVALSARLAYTGVTLLGMIGPIARVLSWL
jgi:hypothetical protein